MVRRAPAARARARRASGAAPPLPPRPVRRVEARGAVAPHRERTCRGLAADPPRRRGAARALGRAAGPAADRRVGGASRAGARAMSGALLLASLLAAGAKEGELPLHLSTSRTTVGDRVEVTVEAEQPGTELRFALAPQLDPALALTKRELLAPRDGRPGMRLQLVACAPGSIAVGPFAL